jgi:hypothetical protein
MVHDTDRNGTNSTMKRIVVLFIAGLVTAGVHLLFEVLVSVLVGPFSEVYPFLKDLTTETVWVYLSVFGVQGLLISLAYHFLEPAFSKSGVWRKGFLFGFVLWILSAIPPVLPLSFLYRIGFDVHHALNAILSGFILAELMGIAFVFSYTALLRKC